MPLNEGQTVQYTVTTTNAPDGLVLYWRTTGNTVSSDIVGGNTGTITIFNNTALINVAIVEDGLTDNSKELGIALATGSQSGPTVATTDPAKPIIVLDTSRQLGYNVDILMVAGGGAAGYGAYASGGAGGAGGYVSLNVALIGGVYTITVGAGGAGANAISGSTPTTAIANRGSNGANSSIVGPPAWPVAPFGPITATNPFTLTAWGGGGGGTYTNANPTPGPSGTPIQTYGGVGGSGGSNSYLAGSPSGGGQLAVGSPGSTFPAPSSAGPQGYPAGSSNAGGHSAGGGGAGGQGQPYPPGAPFPGVEGWGGGGLSSNITGTAVIIGGGGAGSSVPGPYHYGSPGGGGSGSSLNGVVNTGGGAGATRNSPFNQAGGSGGSGIVIISVPTPSYLGPAPGATVTTPPATPGRTILTYTSSGTYNS
jgi:hypothetical protein